MTQNEHDTLGLREFYMQMPHETVVDMLMEAKEQETFLDYMKSQDRAYVEETQEENKKLREIISKQVIEHYFKGA